MKFRSLILCVALLLTTSTAWASLADFSYTWSSPKTDRYTFHLDVQNLNPTANLDFFIVTLNGDAAGYNNYSNIVWDKLLGWTGNVDLPTQDLGGYWFAGDLMADDSYLPPYVLGNGGIASGATAHGFQFSFDYNGPLAMGDQVFSYYAAFGSSLDPNGGVTVAGEDTGVLTNLGQENPGPNPVPEPGTVALVGLGLAGLVLARRNKKG